MNKESKIYIAGHTGVIGNAIYQKLLMNGYKNIIVATHDQLELTNQYEVNEFFLNNKPEYVFYCAGRDGTADFFEKNKGVLFYTHILMQSNIIEASRMNNVKKLIYIGSGACYGNEENVPFQEDNIVHSIQKSGNEFYAVAKVAGVEMCAAYNSQYGTNFIPVIPTHIFSKTNLMRKSSNILEEIIKKLVDAKKNNIKNCKLDIWGEGKSLTQYLYDEDCADMCIFIMNNYNEKKPVNLVYGQPLSLKDVVEIVKEYTEYSGDIKFNIEKKERVNQRYMSGGRLLESGWIPTKSVKERIWELCLYYQNAN